MKKLFFALAMALCTSLMTWADEPFRQHRYSAFQALQTKEGDMLFLGNSITNMHPWREALGGDMRVKNRGNSGGFVHELNENLESFLYQKPAKIFLGIGTNDLGVGETPQQVADEMTVMLRRIRLESPKTQVVVSSIHPRGALHNGAGNVKEANVLIKQVCEAEGATFVDTQEQLAAMLDYDTQLTFDGVHINSEGYKRWLDLLQPYTGISSAYAAQDMEARNKGIYSASQWNASHRMVQTYFAALPVEKNDVLFIGDEMVNGGEWAELLQCPRIKNRGTGWGWPGAPLALTLQSLPYILHDGAQPEHIILYNGATEVQASNDDLQPAKDTYKAIVEKIRELSPSTRITILSLLPCAKAKERTVEFNAWLNTLGCQYIDCYTAFANEKGEPKAEYIKNNYLYAMGYVRLAEMLAPTIKGAKPLWNEKTAAEHLKLLAARKQLGDRLSTLLTRQLTEAKTSVVQAALKEAIDGAVSVLSTSNLKPEVYTAQAEQCDKTMQSLDKYEVMHYLYEFGTPGNDICYRIPAIATAHNGDLVSVVDYRYCGLDIGWGRVSLHARISKDNGDTWGPISVVAEAHEGQYGENVPDDLSAGFGDPALVADSESPNLLLLSCCGNVKYATGTWAHHQGIARFRSNDNGKTWSEFEDIAPAIYDMFRRAGVDIQAMFIGSGRIFQSRIIKVGKFHRLYAVALLRTSKVWGYNYVLYSDDFGETWNILGHDGTPQVTSGDEPKAEELPDGSVILSSRTVGRIFNIFNYSDVKHGLGTWQQQALSGPANHGTVAIGNACNGEIMILPVTRKSDGKKMHVALQSIPYGPARTNVAIYYKGLESPADYATPAALAANWEGRHQASFMSSGYSTMTLQNDGKIGFFYEESTFDNKDYTMVYKRYSLETITGGLYELR